jgi:drug/metabolite transporter (DMT)-like permease
MTLRDDLLEVAGSLPAAGTADGRRALLLSTGLAYVGIGLDFAAPSAFFPALLGELGRHGALPAFLDAVLDSPYGSRCWPELAGVVAFTGLVMTALAFFVMNWAQRHTTAVRAALIYALEPVSAAVFSWWAIGEQLGTAGWAGGLLVVAGVVAGELGGLWEARAEARTSRP